MTFLLIAHIIGVAIGAGGATMSDILFLTSITDNYLDMSELKLLRRASHLVIVGLILLYVTGIGFLFVRTEGVGQRFWAKQTVVAILTINGLVMHRKVFPLLQELATKKIPLSSTKFHSQACLLIWTGAISSVSWYTALILGAWRSLDASYGMMVGLYLSAIVWAVAIGRTLFYYFFGKATAKSSKPKLGDIVSS